MAELASGSRGSPATITRLGVLAVGSVLRAAQFGMLAIGAPFLLDRGVPVRAIGIIICAALIGSIVAQVLLARLVDFFGPWRAVVTGCAVAALGMLALALLASWPLLAVAYCISAMGISVTQNGIKAALAIGISKQNKERAYGELSSAQMTGGMVGPFLVGFLVTQGTWTAPWFASGVLASAAIIATACRARTTEPTGTPGLADDATPTGRTGQTVSFMPLLQVVLPFVILVSCTSTLYGIYSVLWGLYLRHLGANNLVIAWSFAAFSLPMAIVARRVDRILPGTDRRFLAAGACLAVGAIAFVYAAITNTWAAVGLSVIEGAILAVAAPLVQSLISQQVPSYAAGRAFGVAGAVDSASSGVGTALAGVLLAFGGIPFCFRVGGTYCLLGTICALAFALRVARRQARQTANLAQ